jgi:FMNH2-dependent dimethyl sulfone monooxygenase
MKFGIWTPLPHTVYPEPAMAAALQQSAVRGTKEPDLAFEFAADVVRKAESYGFSITLVAERYLGPDLESWMLSAALAARTKTIEIMPAVHPGIISPHVAAKMGAALDRISGGRCAVNVVSGWHKEEFELFGNGWLDEDERRYGRIDEFIRVLTGLWTEDKFSFDGEFFKADGKELPFKPQQRPCPPIYAASRSETGKDLIARHCDTWFIMCGADHTLHEANVREVAQNVADMRKRSAAHGRKTKCGLNALVICARTMEEAQAQANRLAEYGKTGRIPFIAVSGIGVGLIGTPEVIAERIRHLEDIGVDLLMLKFCPMLDQLDVFATEVMPLLGDDVVSQKRAMSAEHLLQSQRAVRG